MQQIVLYRMNFTTKKAKKKNVAKHKGNTAKKGKKL